MRSVSKIAFCGLAIFCIAALFFSGSAEADQSGSRMALVIGNSSYTNLPKPSQPGPTTREPSPKSLKAMGYKARLLIDGSDKISGEKSASSPAILKRPTSRWCFMPGTARR